MRRVIVSFLIVFSVFSLLCSCTSAQSLSKSIKTGYPVWYYNPQVRMQKKNIGFSGAGLGETERQAELIAYTEILSRISEYLGTDIDREKSREFLTLGKIEDYGMKVTDSIFSQNSVSSYSAVVRVTAEREKLDRFRSEQAVENEKIVIQIEELIRKGDECIMDSRDISGVSYYIQSLALSYGMENIPQEYSFNEIMGEVLDIIKSSRIEIYDSNPNNPSCTLRVKRKESVLYENIVECPVKASFVTKNNLGDRYEDSITFDTDRNGKVSFKTLNNAIARSGQIVFTFNLDKDIDSLSLVSAESALTIKNAIEDKKQVFEYGKESSMSALGVCVYEYDNSAVYSGSEKFTAFLSALLADEKIVTVPFTVDGELDGQTLCDEFFSNHQNCRFVLNVKINPIETIESSNNVFAVNVEGFAVLYDLQGNVVFDSNLMFATGFGSSVAEARNNAFERFCQIVCNRIKVVYV